MPQALRILHEHKVREHLRGTSDSLYTRFKAFEIQARKLLEYSQAGSHLSYTTHGISHITRVERIYDWLLSDEDIGQFSPSEAFCLLCATYCHDVFMIPRSLGDEPRARAEHASKAAAELRRLQAHLGISMAEATHIGEIIRGHHVESIEELSPDAVLGADPVRVRLLGACLSMADICHADESRAPRIVFEYLSIAEDSARHWKRHMQISGINRSGDRIVMSTLSFSEDGKHTLEKYAADIKAQLRRVSPYFHSVLTPIVDVELRNQELESELDQDLSFRADTSAVLNMLVSGVYQDPHVFIRELIQNSLDATYVEAARCKRNAFPYRPRIAVTAHRDARGKLLALRVDDNGCGMDLAEVKDTLLCIGQSRDSSGPVRELLKETGKSLIATFGVGLLSCFRVAASLVVQTQKGGGGQPFEVQIRGYGDKVHLKVIDADVGGSTVVVTLQEEFQGLDVSAIVRHYCRMVGQADLHILVTGDEAEFRAPRQSLFAAVDKSGVRVDCINLGERAIDIVGNGYYCNITLPWQKAPTEIVSTPRTINIFNDGIFVCEERTDKWLPPSLAYCTGFINFAAKAVDLPVARNAIVSNQKLKDRLADLNERVTLLFEKMALESRHQDIRDRVAIIFAYAYERTDTDKRLRFLREAGNLTVQLHAGKRMTLLEIVKLKPANVHISHKDGSWVQELGVVDDTKIYYRKDDIVDMRADVAQKSGLIVIHAVRADGINMGTSTRSLRERDIIVAYLNAHQIKVIDLQDSPGVGGADAGIRPLALKKDLRTRLGKRVKFVDTGFKPSKVGWDLGDEIWFNVTNPTVRKIYDRLRTIDISGTQQFALGVLVNLLDNEFNHAITMCMHALTQDESHESRPRAI